MIATKNFFRASAEDFKKIPGSPVAYWVSERFREAFEKFKPMSIFASPKQGMSTCDVDRFVRCWYEVDVEATNLFHSENHTKWIKYNKGGMYRKWYGNRNEIVFWGGNGDELRENNAALRNSDSYFKSFIAWTKISSTATGFRFFEDNFLFDGAGGSLFLLSNKDLPLLLAFLNSKVCLYLLSVISPTINFNESHIGAIPIQNNIANLSIVENIKEYAIEISKKDWDSYETSWDFKVNPLVEKGCNLVNPVNPVKNLSALYSELRKQWADNTTEMRRLETENNRIFIEAYGLQDELTPEVPWNEITLACNPWYRYGVKIEGDGTQELGSSSEMPMDEALEARLKSDTVKELISYAVGCMMGRYSLSKPGLILANQGSTIDDFRAQHQTLNSEFSTPNSNFSPDADGIIPILDDDSFADDIVTQFHRFLRAAFGERNFNENLNFIEDALGKDIRAYFVKDFYPEHLTRYQKRPIYWLFSSPKGTFSALVYMHRYNSGTVGQVLGYLRSHITKIEARVDAADRTTADAAATQGMKSRAIKERAKLVRQLKELEDYEREIMHPLASKRIEIDLDDGVKVNYPKFGEALRKIPGMKKED